MANIEQTLRQMSNELTAKTFAFNSQEAQKEREWSTQMSNTSHQRQVEDLRKAGLNPVLSANSGAQSYSGASASGQADNSAIGMLASIYQTKMNNDNAVKLAKLQNSNNLEIAKINAAASNYAANQSSSASRYGTDMSRYGLVGNFISGANGHGNNTVGSKLGRAFRSNATLHNNPKREMESNIGYKLGTKFFNWLRKK